MREARLSFLVFETLHQLRQQTRDFHLLFVRPIGDEIDGDAVPGVSEFLPYRAPFVGQ
jgi:hypothetical protein